VAQLLRHPLVSVQPVPMDVARPERQQVVRVEAAVRDDLRAGRAPEHLEALRFEAYRLASVSWEDRWAYARVASTEELIAETRRRQGRWADAWLAWRSSWWIRQTLESPGASQRHRVMGLLHARVGRFDDAARRLQAALDGAEAARIRELQPLLHLLAVVDGR